jgi:hypothetical protein
VPVSSRSYAATPFVSSAPRAPARQCNTMPPALSNCGREVNLTGCSSDLPVGRKPRNSRPHPTWKVGRSAQMIPLWVHLPSRHLHIPASGYAPTVAMRVSTEPPRALVLLAPRATGAFFLPPRLTCAQNGTQCAKCLQEGLLEPILPTAASDSAAGPWHRDGTLDLSSSKDIRRR